MRKTYIFFPFFENPPPNLPRDEKITSIKDALRGASFPDTLRDGSLGGGLMAAAFQITDAKVVVLEVGDDADSVRDKIVKPLSEVLGLKFRQVHNSYMHGVEGNFPEFEGNTPPIMFRIA